MQIILVHQRMAQARTFTVSAKHYVFLSLSYLLLVALGASGLYVLTFSRAADLEVPLVRSLLLSATQDESVRKDRFVRENLDVMAVKLGEMQAQLMRLEALGERVSGLAGIKSQEFNFLAPPGRGGAPVAGDRALSMADFQLLLENIARQVEQRADFLNVVETELMDSKLRDKMMPTIQPVNVAYNASGFGLRIDPFNGRQAMHEGIDFIAPTGSPIVAAAGGVVISSEWHHDFGNLIEIDHGNDIVTRYGHASKVYVHVGDIVKRSQHIADVGTTGRSTGAHLHFEVQVKGIAQNPAKFLAPGKPGARAQTVAVTSPHTSPRRPGAP